MDHGTVVVQLLELAPRWWGNGSRQRLGVTFLCPHCLAVRLGVAFKNPVDGGDPAPIVTAAGMPNSIRAHVHTLRTFDVPPGFLWTRTGLDFESLTLTPSVDASASGHWHGSITNGAAA